MTSSRSETVRPEPVEGRSTDKESEQASFFVYMLHCKDGSYYTNHTDDLESRLAAHHAGDITTYTRHKRPVTLVYSESFPTKIEAMGRERQIKSWKGQKKRALARGDWELFQTRPRAGGWVGLPLRAVDPRILF